MEPRSPLQQFGVNPFPSRSKQIYKQNSSLRVFRALIKGRANEKREITIVLSYVKQQAGGAFMQQASFELCRNKRTESRFRGIICIFLCFEQYKMLIMPLNLDSVLLLLHNSKLAYSSALQKKMVLYINLLWKGLTQEINGDRGSI